jgi:hypothetical protein
MATMPPCICTCTTTDSGLSITASVVSIVTLAYVLLVSVIYQFALHRSAYSTTKLHWMIADLRGRLDGLAKWMQNGFLGPLDVEAAIFVQRLQFELQEMEEQLRMISIDDKHKHVGKIMASSPRRDQEEKVQEKAERIQGTSHTYTAG